MELNHSPEPRLVSPFSPHHPDHTPSPWALEDRGRTSQFIYQKSLKFLLNDQFGNTVSEVSWRAMAGDGIVTGGGGQPAVLVPPSSCVPFGYHIKAANEMLSRAEISWRVSISLSHSCKAEVISETEMPSVMTHW